MKEEPFYIGLDVGGTGIKAGILDARGKLLHSRIDAALPEAGPEAGLKLITETMRNCLEESEVSLGKVAGIGAAVPGILDLQAGMVLNAVNLKGWQRVPVREHLQKVFGKPTAFLNDANAAALGEAWLGAGQGADSMAFLTLGTGIGGGLVHKGRLIEGKHGLAGEVGHMKVEMIRPRPCSCGQFGCLEAYAGGASVIKRAYEALAEDFNKISDLHGPADAKTLSCKDVFEAAMRGDPLADRLVEETALALAVGIVNLLHLFDPEKVVLGGGMIAAGIDFLNRVRWFVKDQSFPECSQGEAICYATLGNEAGILGAGIAARLLVQESSHFLRA